MIPDALATVARLSPLLAFLVLFLWWMLSRKGTPSTPSGPIRRYVPPPPPVVPVVRRSPAPSAPSAPSVPVAAEEPVWRPSMRPTSNEVRL